MLQDDVDPELVLSMNEAQSSLDVFLDLVRKHEGNEGVCIRIMVPIQAEGNVHHYWYDYKGVSEGMIIGERQDLPHDLQAFTTIQVPITKIEDWMINDHGHLHGGYTLRLQRSRLPERERKKFDIYMRIKGYE